MRVGLLTYDCPHLKTEQVVRQITNLAGFSFEMFALPFRRFKPRTTLISHRPDQAVGTPTEALAAEFGIPFHRCADEAAFDGSLDLYIVLGAQLLSESFVKGRKILNLHPGLIPAARGLDSFKWSIHNDVPLGVTLHYIDESVDAGEIIAHRLTPVLATDTLERLARRHYENEIQMLSEFPEYLKGKPGDLLKLKALPPQGRMPVALEEEVIQRFSMYCMTHSQKF